MWSWSRCCPLSLVLLSTSSSVGLPGQRSVRRGDRGASEFLVSSLALIGAFTCRGNSTPKFPDLGVLVRLSLSVSQTKRVNVCFKFSVPVGVTQ